MKISATRRAHIIEYPDKGMVLAQDHFLGFLWNRWISSAGVLGDNFSLKCLKIRQIFYIYPLSLLISIS